MTKTTGFASKRRWPAVTAGIMLTATLALGGFAGSASAEDRGRGWDHRESRHRHWDGNGGYYQAPPVVYGTPYYAPPLIYGPGLSINIR